MSAPVDWGTAAGCWIRFCSASLGMVAGRDGGAFSRGAALRFVPAVGVAARTRADFVAWPIGDYPRRYYADDTLLSFTALPDRTRKFANRDVDYADAQVQISERGGRQLQVRNLSDDHEGFGVPNSLQFRVPRLQPEMIYIVPARWESAFPGSARWGRRSSGRRSSRSRPRAIATSRSLVCRMPSTCSPSASN